jgi:hypothetical protein
VNTWVLAFIIGLLGMAAHWFSRWSGKRTKSDFLTYFFRSEPMRSLGALCAYLGAFASLVATGGEMDHTQFWFAVFMAGYTADSAINQG